MCAMAALPDSAGSRAQRAFGTLLVAALVLVLAWQLAHWTWVFVAPPGIEPAAPSATGVDLHVASRLFGGAPTTATPAAASMGLRLKGVVAPSPASTASAVFNAGGKDIAVMIDGEIQPGVRLVAVEPGHAVVSRAGVRERIDLDMRMPAVPRSVAGQPAGFKLNVKRAGTNSYTFARKDLEEALKDPNQLNYLGRIGSPPGGGVRLDEAPPGSLASRLGLQPGDIIKKVNGTAVASAGDLARLHQQFATTSLITAEVQRGTAVVQLNYTVQ